MHNVPYEGHMHFCMFICVCAQECVCICVQRISITSYANTSIMQLKIWQSLTVKQVLKVTVYLGNF